MNNIQAELFWRAVSEGKACNIHHTGVDEALKDQTEFSVGAERGSEKPSC